MTVVFSGTASQTPRAPNAVSAAQVTELYGAVFCREPDVALQLI
jgi:hypothetical protein